MKPKSHRTYSILRQVGWQDAELEGGDLDDPAAADSESEEEGVDAAGRRAPQRSSGWTSRWLRASTTTSKSTSTSKPSFDVDHSGATHLDVVELEMISQGSFGGQNPMLELTAAPETKATEQSSSAAAATESVETTEQIWKAKFGRQSLLDASSVEGGLTRSLTSVPTGMRTSFETRAAENFADVVDTHVVDRAEQDEVEVENEVDHNNAWTECVDDESGRTYYYNHQTGESAWERPAAPVGAVLAGQARTAAPVMPAGSP